MKIRAIKPTKANLLVSAKRYVSRAELEGRDYQQAVWEVANSKVYRPLFEGLNEEAYDDLLNEIGLGANDI